MEKEIEKYQIENIYRFKAIDGSKKEENDINFITTYNNFYAYTLACTLSHLECIKQAGKKGQFPFIIFEDDMSFLLMPVWKKNIDELIEEMPVDCDILKLSFHPMKNNKSGFNRSNQHSAGAYLVTKQGYNKIMKKLYYDNKWNLIKEKFNTEHFYADTGLFDICNTYFYKPCLFLLGTEKIKTTIGNANREDQKNKILLKDYFTPT